MLQHNVGFFADRHSSEFMARLTTGAAAATQALNLLITAIGRDLFSLIGLAAVMAVQDPVMSLFSVIVVPPAMLILRKMIRRIKTVAHQQFTGSTRILETHAGDHSGHSHRQGLSRSKTACARASTPTSPSSRRN